MHQFPNWLSVSWLRSVLVAGFGLGFFEPPIRISQMVTENETNGHDTGIASFEMKKDWKV